MRWGRAWPAGRWGSVSASAGMADSVDIASNAARGNFFACRFVQTTGISFDGGYGEYMLAPASARGANAGGAFAG